MDEEHDPTLGTSNPEPNAASGPSTRHRPRGRRRRRVLLVIVPVVVVLLVAVAGGWVLMGPPNGPLPAWVNRSLPSDISAMQLSGSDRFALVTDVDDSTVIDLMNGKSAGYQEGLEDYQAGNSFITDDGISGIIHNGSVTGYGPDGHRIWRLPLDGFGDPRRVALSERTVAIADDCKHGADTQSIIGVDIRTGKVRWRKTLTSCDFHASGVLSEPFLAIPDDTDGQRWDITTIDDGHTVRTLTGKDLWTARDGQLLTVEDGSLTATAYPGGARRWSTEVCPAASGYVSLGGSTVSASLRPVQVVIVACGDDSHWVVDPRDGRHAPLPDGMDKDSPIQQADHTLVGVRQDGNQVVATDLLTGEQLWNRKEPADSVFVRTTPKYAVITSNDHSHNTFTVVDLHTGKERAHSPAWGDWWAGSAGSQGVWVTHRSLCSDGFDCRLHTTYLLH